VLFFCWIATIWRGSLTFETPMLFAIGFSHAVWLGWFDGLVLADAAADPQYHNAYFLVAHFHYALYPTTVMGAMAAMYYWLPKWTGHMLNERLGRLHFWVAMIGFNLTFIPQFLVGLAGMPRRIPDYPLDVHRVEHDVHRGCLHSGRIAPDLHLQRDPVHPRVAKKPKPRPGKVRKAGVDSAVSRALPHL
jgi:heme/copper-type cytochrome/quinol oxidase subunit 1